MKSVLQSFALICGAGVFAAAAPAPAGKEIVDTVATVVSVHEEPAGSTLPGVHLEAKLNGRMSDIYLAPASFLDEFGMSFRTGEDVHIVGSRTKAGGIDVVLAREIAAGGSEKRTLYLRDEKGPFWDEKAASVTKKPLGSEKKND